MIEPGAVLEVPNLGIRFEMRKTAAETGGELLEFDVVGRARGVSLGTHMHRYQSERYEVIDGSLRLVLDGREHVLGPGDVMEVPAGTVHRQMPGGEGPGRVRMQVRPAGRTEAFLERLAALPINRWGYPAPRAGAAFVREFWADSPPALPRLASREYVFVDEWDIAAPRESVFAAIADARSYPDWWKPVYIDVESEGEPEVGKMSRQHFKGRLPYHLRTRSRITRLTSPHAIGAEVDGDLRGTGLWTLTEIEGGTHVRFDWQVHADRALLRVLTPVLRPALRWNHAWAIARAREGLEPYARALRPAGAARVPTTAR
jgi:mannose-6-phosphate isomerase-like protein (cupin superfamily)/uncharacterized protein YndB with AHSA1/START domain